MFNTTKIKHIWVTIQQIRKNFYQIINISQTREQARKHLKKTTFKTKESFPKITIEKFSIVS